MRYRISVAALVGTCTVVALGLPTAGATPDIGEKDNGLSICEERYLELYAQAHDKFGAEAVGANVVDDGMDQHEPYGLPEGLACAKADVLDGMLNPPEVEYVEPSSVESGYAGGGYASSATVQCESGGDYSINTGNGYYGAYQFDSGTWDAYGDPAYGEASDAPPAVQDAAAASVPYDAWPNC